MWQVRGFGDNLTHLLCLSLSFSLASHLSVPFWSHFVTHFFQLFSPWATFSKFKPFLLPQYLSFSFSSPSPPPRPYFVRSILNRLTLCCSCWFFLLHYYCHFTWLSLFGFPFHLNPFFCFLASSFLSATLYHPLSCSLSSSCSTYHCISVLTRSASPSVLPLSQGLMKWTDTNGILWVCAAQPDWTQQAIIKAIVCCACHF